MTAVVDQVQSPYRVEVLAFDVWVTFAARDEAEALKLWLKHVPRRGSAKLILGGQVVIERRDGQDIRSSLRSWFTRERQQS